MTIDFAKLPKVSLHDHLDGGLRPQTIIELSAEIGHQLPADNHLVSGRRRLGFAGALSRNL
ncbi:MAG: hypothetical protein RIS80_1031 [Actinomycetota bacterium]